MKDGNHHLKNPRCIRICLLVADAAKAEVTGTCNDVTGTEDAILLSDYVRYPGIPIELTHKRYDTGIKTRQNLMYLKPEPAAGASTRLRPVSAARWMPVGHLFSLVLLMLMGLLCVGAGHAPEMYNNGQGTAG